MGICRVPRHSAKSLSPVVHIFIRSHELEWQHHAAQTSTARAACCAPAYQLPLFYTLAFMEASLFGVLDVEGLQIQATPSAEPRVRAGRVRARIPDG